LSKELIVSSPCLPKTDSYALYQILYNTQELVFFAEIILALRRWRIMQLPRTTGRQDRSCRACTTSYLSYFPGIPKTSAPFPMWMRCRSEGTELTPVMYGSIYFINHGTIIGLVYVTASEGRMCSYHLYVE
jgi:hypothetical protein